MTEKTYPAASLETAACLWEAVLELLHEVPAGETAQLVEAARERIGTGHLRLTVIGWTDAADEDWAKVKTDLWDKPFDWEWIPEWLANNADWSSHLPVLRSPRVVPGEA